MSIVKDGCIQTWTGLYVDLIDPQPEQIRIEDIAHSLSNLARFNGHTREFYSVAQHCFLCSRVASPEVKWAALMHDAAEAYLGDVARPLKKLIPEYAQMESRMEQVIFGKFNVQMCDEVKDIDLEALATERRDLMAETDEVWPMIEGVIPWPQKIITWSPEKARTLFLDKAMRFIPTWEAA